VDVATGKVVHTGQAASQVSYDAVDAPYAGIAARQDSQQRAASDAARRIRLDLAAWMASHKAP
jgi:LPS-assembly lipoprotein